MGNAFIRNLTSFSRLLILGGAFVLPLAFVAPSFAPIASIKSGVVLLMAYIPLLVWAATGLLERKVQVPTHPIVIAAALTIITTGIATIFSTFPALSFVGHGYERDTFVMVAAFMSFVILIPWLFSGIRALSTLFFAMLGSFSILGMFHVLRLVVGAGTLLPSWFGGSVASSVIGSWNDLGAFAGLVVVTTLAFLFFYPARRAVHLLTIATLVIALCILAVVNIQVVWATIAFTVFFLGMYRLSLMPSEASVEHAEFLPKRSPVAFAAAGIVFVCALAFLLFSSFLGARISDTFAAAHVDVRPSWQGTLALASYAYDKNMILGVGPTQFVNVWTSIRDVGINESLFWDTDFAFGVGILPTFFITLGLLGGLSWLVLIGAWGYGAVQFIRTRPQDSMVHATTLVWLTASGYLLAMFALYVPGTVLLALMGIALGAFVSSLMHMHFGSIRVFSTQQNTLVAFLMPTALGLLAFAVCVLMVQSARPMIASAYATRASSALSQADSTHARTFANRAARMYTSDDSAQVKTAVAFAALGQAVQDAEKTQDKNADSLKQLVEEAIGDAQEVVRFDPRNFRNWLFLANAYEQVSGIVGKDAFKSAHTAYDEAQKRAPTSPLVPLLRARLQFAEKDIDGARKSISEALALKQNYTDAYFLLSQIEIQEGNGPEAIQSTQSAILLAPNNPGLRFQLGFLLYASGDYTNAARVLESAVALNPNYANALYFLGLSYDRLGKADDAKTTFAKVLELNPTNEEVKAIMAGLESGTTAIQTLQSLQTPSPAERDVPPVSDGVSSVVQ